MRAGQINLEFLGASLLFFVALIFVINVTFDKLPEYSRNNEINEMNLNLLSLSSALLGEGAWSNGSSRGTDWNKNLKSVKSFGLTTRDYFDEEKSSALASSVYEDVKSTFQIPDNFWIELEEFLLIDTYKEVKFSEWDSLFSFAEHPDLKNAVFHYGSIGTNYYFFLPLTRGAFSKLLVYDGSVYTEYDLTNNEEILINGVRYKLGRDVGFAPQGKVVILSRDLINFGRNEPGISKNTILGSFYMPTKNGGIVKMNLFLWRR